jgi:hypothetical protein
MYQLVFDNLRANLPLLQTFLMEIRKEVEISDRLPAELTTKPFVATVAKIIADWRGELAEWRDEMSAQEEEEPYLRQGPSKDIDVKKLKDGSPMTKLQMGVVRDLVSMLTLTAFSWEDKSVLKGEQQLIKAVAPLILTKRHTKALLATQAGWDMRCSIGLIMQKSLKGVWHGWDGQSARPKVKEPVDKELLAVQAPGEENSSVATRTWLAPQRRQQHANAIQKAVDAVMIAGLGIIGTDPTSGAPVADPEFHKAVSKFITASSSSSQTAWRALIYFISHHSQHSTSRTNTRPA